MEMICLYCQEPLTFDPRRGWIHPEGGAARRIPPRSAVPDAGAKCWTITA